MRTVYELIKPTLDLADRTRNEQLVKISKSMQEFLVNADRQLKRVNAEAVADPHFWAGPSVSDQIRAHLMKTTVDVLADSLRSMDKAAGPQHPVVGLSAVASYIRLRFSPRSHNSMLPELAK